MKNNWLIQLLTVFTAFFVMPTMVSGQQKNTYMVPMSDGVRLATDVYLPDSGTDSYPVVLVRTPYNKDQDATAYDVNTFVNAGAAFVVQDLRGRYDSEGIDCVFFCDHQDGLETLTWIDGQSWCNGTIVSQGASASAIVQYLFAADAPASLKAMFVEKGTPDLYNQAIFQNDVPRSGLLDYWLSGQNALFIIDTIEEHQHPQDTIWETIKPAKQWNLSNVSAIHYGGWFDVFAQGTLDAFMGYEMDGGSLAKGHQYLIMGPWTHWNTSGELVFPYQSQLDFPGSQAWLLDQLGLGTPVSMPKVQYYTMGESGNFDGPGNEWRQSDTWPINAAPIRLYLKPNEVLGLSCPHRTEASSSYTSNPDDPVPTLGGLNLNPNNWGPQNQASILERDDVLLFQTPVLNTPMEITGRVSAHLYVSTDAADVTVIVRMMDIYPDGKAMLILDAPARLASYGPVSGIELVTPGEVQLVDIDLWSTSIIIAPEHRLAIAVSSSNVPRFWNNPQDGSSFGCEGDNTPANVTIHHDSMYPSHIIIPNPDKDADDVILCSSTDYDILPETHNDDDGGCSQMSLSSWWWIALLGLIALIKRNAQCFIGGQS